MVLGIFVDKILRIVGVGDIVSEFLNLNGFSVKRHGFNGSNRRPTAVTEFLDEIRPRQILNLVSFEEVLEF